jgi:hypothetical protein
MATRMQQRRGTADQWTSADPILASGEIGFESDTSQFKIGDGTNHWSDLSYFKNLEDLGGTLDDYIPLTQKDAANGVATLDSSGQVPFSQLGNIIDGAPGALNTLNELAAAIDDNSTFASAITTSLGGKLSLTGGTMTGSIDMGQGPITNLPTPEGSNHAATKGYVDSEVGSLSDTVSDIDGRLTAAEGTVDSVPTLISTAKSEAISDSSAAADTKVSDHNSDTTNVHGISDTSALVTLTGTQTLTGKTISAADNTVTINAADITDVTASASELNILDGATLTVTELNYVGGVTSAIQTQIDAKADLADPTFTGTLTAADLEITGNLIVGGTTTTVNATDLEITDPLIYMSSGNWTTDVVDVGFLAATGEVGGTEGSHKHSGLFRDVSDSKKWKLVSNVQHPVSNTIDLTDAVYDTLKVGGIEYSDGTQVKQGVPSLTAINQQTSGYTTVLTDRDKLVEVSSASGVTVTIPANSTVAYPVGTSIDILQTGSGQVTIAGAGGVTVNATPGLKLRTQWSSATLFKRATDTWVVFGDLTA